MKKDSGGNYGLADTWRLNHRVNLLLLDHLSAEQLAFAANPRARSIADQFAHIHNVRILWLEHTAPKLAASLKKIGKGTATKKVLQEALESSSEAIGNFIAEAEQGGTMKGSKRGPIAFFGYALAHEAHHRGQIIVHLKHAKLPIDPMVGF